MSFRRYGISAISGLAMFITADHASAQATEVAGPARADALRIYVPPFFARGDTAEEVLARVVSMAVYYEVLKAFGEQGSAERGAWILYGGSLVPETHRMTEAMATKPSTTADLVFWGGVTRIGEDLVVEPSLSMTSLARQRNVQPDILSAEFKTADGVVDVSIANSSRFFDLWPFSIPREAAAAYADPDRGVPIYNNLGDPEPETFWKGPIYFQQVTNDALQVRYQGRKLGWVRLPTIPNADLTMIDFGRALIQILRGNWVAAERALTELANRDSLPNALRVDVQIYLGLAKEKLGRSGLEDFSKAWTLNEFDQDAAKFLLLGMLFEARRRGELNDQFASLMSDAEVLFAENDEWISDVRRIAEDFEN